MSRVRPGVELVLTNRLRPMRVLIREDFPTLDRPAKAISGKIAGGYWDGLAALFTNSADFTIMLWSGMNSSFYVEIKVLNIEVVVKISFQSIHLFFDIFQ